MGWEGLARIDVEKSASHHLSHNEIAGDNPCYRHLSAVASITALATAVLVMRAVDGKAVASPTTLTTLGSPTSPKVTSATTVAMAVSTCGLRHNKSPTLTNIMSVRYQRKRS